MSTIQATNISDGTISVPTTVVTKGTAKALVSFDQTAPSTARSENVSSVTDTATGDYTVNFTNSFDAADYAIGAFARDTNDNTSYGHYLTANLSDTYATGSCQHRSALASAAAGDGPQLDTSYPGDLA
jgi:hypothetical protein